MDFDETVAALELLAGTSVDLWVFGTADDAPDLVSLSGVLSRMSDPEDLPPLPKGTSSAVIFCVDNNHLMLWPDRFIGAERVETEEAILVRTRDGDVRVGRESRPWID